jgi:glycosyltransferase involved in cell wall biosynthesis
MNTSTSPPIDRFRLCIVAPVHWAEFMGGAQFQIKCLMEHLRTLDRYDMHYLARRVPPSGQVDGHYIHRIGHSSRPTRIGYSPDAPQLLGLLHRLRPHAIYQRFGCSYTGIAAFYARKSGARMIWHASSDADLEPTIRIRERNPVRRTLERTLLNYGIRHSDVIVTQTKRQADALQRNFGRRADAVIANFHPNPEESTVTGGPPCVLWVANFKKLKQPDAFLQLAASLRDMHEVRFIMVGDEARDAGDGEWNRVLMQRLSALPNVEYLGKRTQEQVNALIARATVFVNTSLYEGFPNTFIQAWLRSVPVVSLNVNPDHIFDDETIGFCAGSEARLSQIVRQLLIDKPLRDRIATQAMAYAQRYHSMDNAAYLESLIHAAALASASKGTSAAGLRSNG